MKIARLIEKRAGAQIISCKAQTPVREVIGLLAEKRIGALPIMQDGRITGIFSERDVIYRLAQEGDACLDRQVGEVMTSPPITVARNESVLDALSLMTKRRIRHLPVMDGETMCGFISIGDLVKSRLEEIQHEAAAMREYITQA